ncbi:MAG: hypothetical protein CMM15_10505 [Rhodospirillaceae bacterium]|nr:hypothetical protein [Rhodospirillaceae bacterium]OUX67998.1 MAG: hypothetical protein CBD38_00840 [bacterium TMED178]|tara:strand:+ start:323 stop:820 length:498 start_codon:yes stop_codon:yes gene_type:complete
MVQVKIGTINIGNFTNILLWFIIIISFIMTVIGLLLSGALQTRTVFDNDISDDVINLIATQMQAYYGLIIKSNSFIPNVKSIQFTNLVSMESDDPCAFRFRVQDCDKSTCALKALSNEYFRDTENDHLFSMQASGTKNDSFVFPVPNNRTFIIKNDNKSVANWDY